MATLMKLDGTTQEIKPADPKRGFTLEELYALIGCEMVELVYLDDDRLMLLDEEGKLQDGWQGRVNRPATDLFLKGRAGFDVIVGNVVVCNGAEFK